MKISIILLICLAFVTDMFAHNEKKHKPKKPHTVVAKSNEQLQKDTITFTNTEDGKVNERNKDYEITAKWNEFPNLHPLVVHFPIVLLIIASLLQIAGLFVFREPISWITLVILILGFAGAFVAGNFIHPHTAENLSVKAAKVLAVHERFGTLTMWFSGVAVVLKFLSHFYLKRKLWAEMCVAGIMLAAAIFVSIAGHHGSQLVHIEGVGPQGKFLETEHNNKNNSKEHHH